MNVKTCKVCGLTKPASEFYPEPRSKDGLAARCKACKQAKATPTPTPTRRVSELEPLVIKQGESFMRPAWHAWVYGGAKKTR